MVVTFLPATAETGVMHERVGTPSTCTVQAPHCAMPQPNFVPVRPSSSRITHSSGVSAACSEFVSFPLTANLIMLSLLQGSTIVVRRSAEVIPHCGMQQARGYLGGAGNCT